MNGKLPGIAATIAALAVATGVVVFFLPPPAGAGPETMRALGTVIAAVGLWSTAVIPVYLTAIVYFFIAMIFAIAPAGVVFSGFASSAVWLVFGGLVIAVAVDKTGLGARAARALVGRIERSYFSVLAGGVAIALVLAFLMPAATGRVVLLIPIVLALADRMGFAPGRPGRTGLALAVGLGTFIPAFTILPSNVPNVVLIGAAESIYGISFTYAEFLVVNFTVMGVLSAVGLLVLVRALFPDTPEPAAAAVEDVEWSTEERRLLVILVAALALWITDFAHGISPAWVAIAAAVACLMPRVGVIPAAAMTDDVNYAPWFFVAGIIGMGGVVTHTGLGDLMGQALFAVLDLQPGEDAANFAAVYGIGAGVALLTTMPGASGVMTPLAGTIAEATGWPLKVVLMAQVPAWVVFALPYQAPPIILTMMLAGVRMADALKLMVAYAVFGVIVILPAQFLWWRVLGLFG